MRALLTLVFIASLGLSACGGSSGTTSVTMPRALADSTPSTWQPLPPAGPVSPDVAAARLAILGPDSQRSDRVTVWWAGVSSFIVSAGGHLFFLDAWEVVGVHKGYVPLTRDELVAIQPEAIFIGHGHFDHAADAGYVASRTGATLIAGDSVCDTARRKVGQRTGDTTFSCLRLGLDADLPAGTVLPIKIFSDLPEVQVIKHTHSAAEPSDLAQGGTPLVFVPNLLPFILNLNLDANELLGFVQSLPDDGAVGQPEGGTWAYHFRVGDFSLFWHDSTGPMAADNPEATAIRTSLSQLPGCVDVQIGAIVGFGMVTSAYRDALAYVDAARPQVFIPSHHDAWFPIIGGGAQAYEQQWTAGLNALAMPPQQDYLRDPEDYLVPRSFDINDPRWQTAPSSEACANKLN